jgi:ribonuclease P/MRP protein subunit RPP1
VLCEWRNRHIRAPRVSSSKERDKKTQIFLFLVRGWQMSVNMCVPEDAPALKQVLLFLMRFGWSGCCVTTTVARNKLDSATPSKVDALTAGLTQTATQGMTDEFTGETLARVRVAAGQPPFRLYTRLTVRVSDPQDLHAYDKSAHVNGFDILSLRPENDDMLIRCCESASVDVVTLDFSLRGNWNAIITKNVSKLGTRDAFFEVCCSPAFRSKDTDRVSFFSNVRKLVQALRGRHLILSLDARDWHETRGPFDLVNLGVMCGMTEAQAREAVFDNPIRCLERGALRAKTWRSAVGVMPESEAVRVETAFDNAEGDAEEKKKKKKKKKKGKKEKREGDKKESSEGQVTQRQMKKQRKEVLDFYTAK